MSEGNTNFLLNLINTLLASHGDTAPFLNHSDMHDKIGTTTLGEAPWDHFTLKYNGTLPEGVSQEKIPTWMTDEHEIWFCNPVTFLENLLATLISTNLMMCLIKSAHQMGHITFMMLCQAIGPGNKRYIHSPSICHSFHSFILHYRIPLLMTTLR